MVKVIPFNDQEVDPPGLIRQVQGLSNIFIGIGLKGMLTYTGSYGCPDMYPDITGNSVYIEIQHPICRIGIEFYLHPIGQFPYSHAIIIVEDDGCAGIGHAALCVDHMD